MYCEYSKYFGVLYCGYSLCSKYFGVRYCGYSGTRSTLTAHTPSTRSIQVFGTAHAPSTRSTKCTRYSEYTRNTKYTRSNCDYYKAISRWLSEYRWTSYRRKGAPMDEWLTHAKQAEKSLACHSAIRIGARV